MYKNIVVIVLTASPAYTQQGGEIIGESPLTAGTAGASIGSGQSVVDASSNPSTLIHVFENERGVKRQQRFESMVRAVHYNTAITTSTGEELAIDLPVGMGPWMGYAARINDEWAWGVNLQPTVAADFSTTRNTTLNLVTEDPFDPNAPLLDSRIEQSSQLLQMALEPNLSMRLNDSWSIGVGASIRHTDLSMVSATEVDFDTLQGDFVLGAGTWGDFFRDAGGESFQATFDAEASSNMPVVFLKLGATYSTPRGNNIGFWLRPRSTSSDIEGRINVDMRDDLGKFITVLEDNVFGEGTLLTGELVSAYDFAINDVAFPAQVGVSFSSAATSPTRWHSKVVFTQWSKTMTDWSAHLSNPSNDEFTGYVGGDGSIDIDMGIDWNDTLALSVGFEHDVEFNITTFGDRSRKINDYTLRGGLGWSTNPVAGAALPGLTPFNQWHVAVGISSWSNDRDPLDIHMAFVATLPETWTAGENALLSDQSYDEFSQFAYSFMVGCSYSF
jgi:long-subunit fatty acid transport protein